MHTSEGCNPGKVRERGCVLKERRIRMDRTCARHLPICGVPSERVGRVGRCSQGGTLGWYAPPRWSA
jgi:hypothetical protein